MSLQKLHQLKDILLGPDHEPEQVLVNLFHQQPSSENTQHSVIIEEYEEPPPPAEKIARLEIIDLDQLMQLLENFKDEDLVTKICPAFLRHREVIQLSLNLIDKHEQVLLENLYLPWLRTNEMLPPSEILGALNASSHKTLLEALNENQTSDWTQLQKLNKLDYQDPTVQKNLASILIKHGLNKDLSLGKYMLSIIKKMPRSNSDLQLRDLWVQAVSLHESFLSKACSAELSKMFAK